MTNYTPGETRYRDPATGGEKEQKEARLGGSDPLALMELAKVYGMGEEKYARYNYLKGYPWSLSVDALYRHLLAFLAGEDKDPESGLLHTAHVAWHALTLTSFIQRNVGTDDRAPAPPAQRREHVLSADCWCKPKVEYVPGDADPSEGMSCDHGVFLATKCYVCEEDAQ